ncbi:MAG: hypothetical protein CO073_03840 [Candidatus Komeilibacteria bacterium CG_4_9_14_0_8_um_filter_36_9]|uniref:DUF4406 domain-containing protein n=1 Tax=Candidatus Komeilibacteria bacterium CG_4_9_14_0_8_um_filter_36_9 TaxID=1974473 RepID=A0A2M8DQK5_9BACT|nr:MAG: hypothetical protein CO073_03840 [Candidatus Komeilibacteria bacterium CG_4_9_14_0_8_um_filter_36_9]
MYIYILSPVRKLTDFRRKFLLKYAEGLEKAGHLVHLPLRDTPQDDQEGLTIFKCNRQAIANADEIHVYWTSTSTGSVFDLGMLFGFKKSMKLINRDVIKPTPHASFENILIALDEIYRANSK